MHAHCVKKRGRSQALNRTAYFAGTGHEQDHFNRQTIDVKCVSTVQARAATALERRTGRGGGGSAC